jgi:hypothetical protein
MQIFLQFFIKSYLTLWIFIHLCMPLVRLHLYLIIGLIYITNVQFELL